MTYKYRKIVILLLAACPDVAFARSFTTSRDDFKPSLKLPVTVKEETVAPTKEQLAKRVLSAQTDSRVEPLYLAVPVGDDERAALALKLARPKKYRQLLAGLDVELERSGNAMGAKQEVHGPSALNQDNQNNPQNDDDRLRTVKVRVSPALFRLMSPGAVLAKLQRMHDRVVVDSVRLREQPELRSEFLVQLAPFLGASELRKVSDILRSGAPLDVDAEVLPLGPRRAVKTFEIFRGPNCFMTALAFQYPRMVRSQLVNIKAEADHHEVMINNDELWRVLQSSFYEVDPGRSPLKYGDMLVFFQLPAKDRTPPDSEVSFRWIKHATTYLFNDFVYSKGSKSPNSPYVVGTLRSEWGVWEKHVASSGGRLGVKVFRKPLKSATSRPPKSLDDWMY